MNRLIAFRRHLSIIVIIAALFALSPTPYSLQLVPVFVRPRAFMFSLIPLTSMFLIHGKSVFRGIFIERDSVLRRGLQSRITIFGLLTLILLAAKCLKTLDDLDNIGPNVMAGLTLFFWLLLQSWYLCADRDCQKTSANF